MISHAEERRLEEYLLLDSQSSEHSASSVRNSLEIGDSVTWGAGPSLIVQIVQDILGRGATACVHKALKHEHC